MTLLFLRGRSDLVGLDRATGKDIYSPGIRGHERICKGLKPYWHQTAVFKMELRWSAYLQPLDELNQNFAMLLVHPDKELLKWYCKINPRWELSIYRYFVIDDGRWRGERELADLMIAVVKERIKE